MTLKNDLDLARGYLPKQLFNSLSDAFKPRASIGDLRAAVIEAVEAHSRKNLPKALANYIDAWNEIDDGELPITSHLRSAILSRIETRAWRDIRKAEAEYWYMRRPQVDAEDQCSKCEHPFTEGSWVCKQCSTRRGLKDTRWQNEADARRVLAWNNWDEALNLVIMASESRDFVTVNDMLDRALNLLRTVHGKHFSYDNVRDAVAWFIDNDESDRIKEFITKFKLIFIDYDNDVICGVKSRYCQKHGCNFQFTHSNKDSWKCKKCHSTRTLCMNTFRNHHGRCSKHKTRSNDDSNYYGFKESDLADMYERYVNDPKIVTTHRQIALIDTRIAQLTSTTQGIDAEVIAKYIKSFRKDIDRVAKRLRKAVQEDDYTVISEQAFIIIETAEELFDLIDRARVDKASWIEIRDLMDSRTRQVDSQIKLEISEQYTVSISSYIQALTELASSFVNRLNLIDDIDTQLKIRGLAMADTKRMLDAEVISGEFIVADDVIEGEFLPNG